MPEDITSRLDTLRGRQLTAWQSGEWLQVESLIQSEGVLLTDDEVLELIYVEIMLRSEHGDACAIDEYLRRFPQFTESLRRLFAIHQALEANS